MAAVVNISSSTIRNLISLDDPLDVAIKIHIPELKRVGWHILGSNSLPQNCDIFDQSPEACHDANNIVVKDLQALN